MDPIVAEIDFSIFAAPGAQAFQEKPRVGASLLLSRKKGGQENLPAFGCARLLPPSSSFFVIYRKLMAIAAVRWPWGC